MRELSDERMRGIRLGVIIGHLYPGNLPGHAFLRPQERRRAGQNAPTCASAAGAQAYSATRQVPTIIVLRNILGFSF